MHVSRAVTMPRLWKSPLGYGLWPITSLRHVYFARGYVVAKLFEPADQVVFWLHVIDTYGTLLLLTGFLIWITMDIVFVLRKHLGKEGKDEQDEQKRDGK